MPPLIPMMITNNYATEMPWYRNIKLKIVNKMALELAIVKLTQAIPMPTEYFSQATPKAVINPAIIMFKNLQRLYL